MQTLSIEEPLIRLCTFAGFVQTVALGQFFMTKNDEEFFDFNGQVGYREYTVPRDEESSTPRGWFRGNTKMGLVLEVTTKLTSRQARHRARFYSLSGDGSHSWVRFSNGLNKFVRDFDRQSTNSKQQR